MPSELQLKILRYCRHCEYYRVLPDEHPKSWCAADAEHIREFHPGENELLPVYAAGGICSFQPRKRGKRINSSFDDW